MTIAYKNSDGPMCLMSIFCRVQNIDDLLFCGFE